jgi:hypothetical protein
MAPLELKAKLKSEALSWGGHSQKELIAREFAREGEPQADKNGLTTKAVAKNPNSLATAAQIAPISSSRDIPRAP